MLYQNGAVSAEQMEAATRAYEVAQAQAKKGKRDVEPCKGRSQKRGYRAAEMRLQAAKASCV